jgi:glycosyltransferase involved in cell wall biosynthesis
MKENALMEVCECRPTFAVAMATFNGEAYLEQQLQSILSQSRLPNEMVISDDGSTDETLNICQRFAAMAPFPVKLVKNTSRLGFADNFLSCAEQCSMQWLLFCDQDDVWREDKIKKIEEMVMGGPADLMLIYHAASVVSEDLTPLNFLLPNVRSTKINPIGSKLAFWFVGGCVMCFNSKLLDAIPSRSRPADNYTSSSGGHNQVPHDKWICSLAGAAGSIVEIAEPLMMYRRHSAATSSFEKRQYFLQKLRSRFTVKPNAACEESKFCLNLEKAFRNAVSVDGNRFAFKNAAQIYGELAHLFDLRCQIYHEGSIFKRFNLFIELYFLEYKKVRSSRFLRFRHVTKDLAVVIGLRFVDGSGSTI